MNPDGALHPDAGQFPEPRFRAPDCRTAATEAGTVTAVHRPGPGDLVEARLVLPLIPLSPRHCAAAEVYAQLARTAAAAAGGARAVVRVESRPDRITVSARVFAADFARVAARIADRLGPDLFAAPQRVRAAAAAVADRLDAGAGHPAMAARAGFLAAVYGSHPFARPATAELCRALDPADTAALARAAAPARRQAVAVGALPADELGGLAALLLPAVPAAGVAEPGEEPAAPETKAGIGHVHRPGLPQTLMRLGRLVPGRTHEDYPALQLAVLMLGGYYNSRLTLTLRERDGLTYAPRAVLDPVGRTAAFTIEADVRAGGSEQALGVIAHELARLAHGGFEPRELSSAKNYAIGTMAMACSSRSGTASALAGMLGGGLPATWLAGYEPRFRAVTAAAVARVADRHLRGPGLAGTSIGPDPSAARQTPPAERPLEHAAQAR